MNVREEIVLLHTFLGNKVIGRLQGSEHVENLLCSSFGFVGRNENSHDLPSSTMISIAIKNRPSTTNQ